MVETYWDEVFTLSLAKSAKLEQGTDFSSSEEQTAISQMPTKTTGVP